MAIGAPLPRPPAAIARKSLSAPLVMRWVSEGNGHRRHHDTSSRQHHRHHEHGHHEQRQQSQPQSQSHSRCSHKDPEPHARRGGLCVRRSKSLIAGGVTPMGLDIRCKSLMSGSLDDVATSVSSVVTDGSTASNSSNHEDIETLKARAWTVTESTVSLTHSSSFTSYDSSEWMASDNTMQSGHERGSRASHSVAVSSLFSSPSQDEADAYPSSSAARATSEVPAATPTSPSTTVSLHNFASDVYNAAHGITALSINRLSSMWEGSAVASPPLTEAEHANGPSLTGHQHRQLQYWGTKVGTATDSKRETSPRALAKAYLEMGRYCLQCGCKEEAEDSLQRALRLLEHEASTRHSCQLLLSCVLDALGDATAGKKTATQFYERSFDIKFQILGPWHTDTVETFNRLAGICTRSQRQHQQASHMYQQVYELRVAIYGNTHPSVAIAAHMLANVHVCLGKWDDADQNYRLAKNIYSRMGLGPHHSVVEHLSKDIHEMMLLRLEV